MLLGIYIYIEELGIRMRDKTCGRASTMREGGKGTKRFGL